jgi:predicted dehydrogenase
MTESSGVAVVGTGFGARVQVPALRAAGFDVIALVGRDADRTSRRAGRAGVEHACTTLAEALALPRVDAVTIAAPPALHAELSFEAIQAGRHVICEKPFALDLRQATELLAAARQAGIVHALGHELRWFPERVAVGNAIRAGEIGEARLVSVVDFVPLLTDPAIRMPQWFYDAGVGGGWLGASGSHAIDMVRLWLGEFEQVSASTCVTSPEGDDADDTFILQFRLQSGALGVIQQTGAAWAGAGQTAMTGTAGTIGIQSGRVSLANADGRRVLYPTQDAEAATPRTERPTQLESMTNHEVAAYTQLCEAFARSIRGEAPAGDVPLPTFVDGVAVMAVMDAARRSAATGATAIAVEGTDATDATARPG